VELAAGLAVLLAQPIEPLLHDAQVVQQELGVDSRSAPAPAQAPFRRARESANHQAEKRPFPPAPGATRAGKPGTLGGRPGTSTKSISAQLVLRGLKMAASGFHARVGYLDRAQVDLPSRGSPTLVQPVSALNNVVLPDCAYRRGCLHGALRGGARRRAATLTTRAPPSRPACPPDIALP